MLGTYIAGKFAVPENPVMRAVAGAPLLLTAPEQKGVTGFGASAPRGMGCGCSSKIPPFGLGARSAFGLGNVGDEGLRLYGDWYGAQQHGGMILNGDRNGLGTYFPSDAHGYRGFSGLGGLGGVEDFFGSLTQGNYKDTIFGNDFAQGLPNWLVIAGAWWFIVTVTGQQSRARKSVGAFTDRVEARRKTSAKKAKLRAEHDAL